VNRRASVLGLLAASAAGLGLSGCATAPESSLPAVQQQLAARGNVRIAWPQTDAERSARDDAVRRLLAADLTPDSAVAIAVLNNAQLQATFEDVGLSQAELFAAGRLHNPVLFASTRWSDSRPRGPDAEFSLTADLLDDFFIPLRRRLARTAVAAAENRVARAVLDLAAEVRTAAYTLQARQMLERRVQAIAEANEAASDLAQRQFDAGNINRLTLAQNQSAAQTAHLDLLRAQAQVELGRETLNRLLGLADQDELDQDKAERDLRARWRLSTDLPPLPPDDPVPADLEARALAQRLDLAAAHSDFVVAQEAYELRRKTRFSPAAVDAGVDTERNPDGSRVTGPQVSLGLPLFDQGQADLARLGSEVRRTRDRYEAKRADVAAEVRTARAALQSARAVSDYYVRTVLPQQQLLLRETLLNYNAMQKSGYELLLAKEAQLTAERAGIDALRDYWIARTELERAAGGALSGPVHSTDLP
jgi:cobalt-zinc-cadmium efflux system outer membrane protein